MDSYHGTWSFISLLALFLWILTVELRSSTLSLCCHFRVFTDGDDTDDGIIEVCWWNMHKRKESNTLISHAIDGRLVKSEDSKPDCLLREIWRMNEVVDVNVGWDLWDIHNDRNFSIQLYWKSKSLRPLCYFFLFSFYSFIAMSRSINPAF